MTARRVIVVPDTDTTVVSVWIVQRARGVYLIHGSEDRDGTEEWEATSTLAAAKRWAADYLGVNRPKWTEHRKPGSWPIWHAESELEED